MLVDSPLWSLISSCLSDKKSILWNVKMANALPPFCQNRFLSDLCWIQCHIFHHLWDIDIKGIFLWKSAEYQFDLPFGGRFLPKTIGNHIWCDFASDAGLVKIGGRLWPVERSTHFVHWVMEWHRVKTDSSQSNTVNALGRWFNLQTDWFHYKLLFTIVFDVIFLAGRHVCHYWRSEQVSAGNRSDSDW